MEVIKDIDRLCKISGGEVRSRVTGKDYKTTIYEVDYGDQIDIFVNKDPAFSFTAYGAKVSNIDAPQVMTSGYYYGPMLIEGTHTDYGAKYTITRK